MAAHSTHESLTNTRESPLNTHESPTTCYESPTTSRESPSASAQHLPPASASTACQLAAQLAKSLTIPHASQDQPCSSSAPAAQGSASQPQGLGTGVMPPSLSKTAGKPQQQRDQKLLWSQQQPPQTSLPAAEDADGNHEGLCTHEGTSEQPVVAHSPSPDLGSDTSEYKQAIQLSLSHDALPLEQSTQELQHSSDTGQDAEQPQGCMSTSPSRQLSESSELNQAIRMSLSSEFLPEAEPESPPSLHHCESRCSDSKPAAPPHSDPQTPHSEPQPPLVFPSVASPSASGPPSVRLSPNAGEHSAVLVPTPSPHFRSTQASCSRHSSSASDADTLHQQERQSCTAGTRPAGNPPAETPPSATRPLPEDPTPSRLPSPEHDFPEAGAAPGSPEPVKTNVQQASNSPGQSQAQSAREGNSHLSPAPTASLPSSSQHTPPPAILTSPSPQPPNPSPGTAAQIDGDAALARQLQNLELGDESADGESSAPVAPAEAVDDDVDLAALQDVEVPLVGDQLPLAALVEDYEGSPRVCGNLVPLMQRFPYFRRIRGWSPFNVIYYSSQSLPFVFTAYLT